MTLDQRLQLSEQRVLQVERAVGRVCAIGWLAWSARWCRSRNGGSIFWNGGKLLFPKGQASWAGSLLRVPALFLVVRSLLLGVTNTKRQQFPRKNLQCEKHWESLKKILILSHFKQAGEAQLLRTVSNISDYTTPTMSRLWQTLEITANGSCFWLGAVQCDSTQQAKISGTYQESLTNVADGQCKYAKNACSE